MPKRRERVRVSIRKRTETKDQDWLSPNEAYSHDSYMILDFLGPVSGRMIDQFDRFDFTADWVGVKSYMKPGKIEDGDRLVTFVDGSPELFLDVQKVMREGDVFLIPLDEEGAVQS